MARGWRWFITCMAGVVAFVAGWLISLLVFHLDQSTSQTIGGAVLGIVSLPLGVWAAVESVHDRLSHHDARAAQPDRSTLSVVEGPQSQSSAAGASAPGGRVRHLVGLIPAEADCFQDRHLLAQVDDTLAAGGTAIVTQMLTGLGGVGKTQLAAAIARSRLTRGDVDVLVWVTARDRQAIVTGLAQAGHQVCGADPTDPQAAAQVFMGWLANTTGRWLVVLDDVADPADVTGLWPPVSPFGGTVVSTRRRDAALAARGNLVPVGVFTRAEAIAYLGQKFAARPDRLGPDHSDAAALAADLGFLPLALGQAAAFIADRDITCAQYRHRLANAKDLVDVVPEPGAEPDDYQLPVAAALLLSTNAADHLSPTGLARPLLVLLSLLDPNGIPTAIPATGAATGYLTSYRTPNDRAPSDTDVVAVTAVQARDGLACLARLNLIDVLTNPTDGASDGGGGERVRVHALVQRATREQTRPDQYDAAAHAAADSLLQAWPQVERDTELGQLLRSNATALYGNAEDQLWNPDGHEMLFRAGRSLGEAGLFTAAITYFDRLTTQATARLGLDHPSTLATRSKLAFWRGEAGDAAGAATAFETLFTDVARVLGPVHPSTLAARYDVARWRGEAGDAAGAAAAFETLLPDRLRVLGPDHPDTLSTRDAIINWRVAAGDPSRAPGFETLLADYLRVFGPDHRSTLLARATHTVWRRHAGDAAGATAALENVLTDIVRVLGPDHPDALFTRADLADWQGEAGDAAGAAAALETLLTDMMRVLGPDHRYTLGAQHSLGRWRRQVRPPSGHDA